jgi:hypothetical protein
MTKPTEYTIHADEEVILILPDGHRVSVVFAEPHDEGSVPELDLHFGEKSLVTCNTWAYGFDNIPDNPHPTECNQVIIIYHDGIPLAR